MQYNRLAAGLLLCTMLLGGCVREERTDIPESLSTDREQTAVVPETVPETERIETETAVPDTEPEEKTTSPIPDGETLASMIRALPDSETLRQQDVSDVVTGGNLDTLPGEQKTALAEALKDCRSLAEGRKIFHEITGYTFHAWRDVLQNRDPGSYTPTAYDDGTAVLTFTGDVCLADDWYNMQAYHRMGGEITNHITEGLRELIAAADVSLMNCECTLSDRGEPTENKLYTFRGKPENAEIFASLGVDIVSLANNHAHDYGRDAFLDTMAALDNAGVAYVGAGENLAEAMQYRSFVADGMKIAYVSASNAEKFRLTPGAKENTPGILQMYDETDFLAAMDKAAAEADVVIAYVHWGTENSASVNADQQKKRDLFLAHGADVIIGAHPHVLQPWEMYEGVPVVYSLGNFWFNGETLDTALASVEVSLTGDGVAAQCVLYACVQSDNVTGLKEEMQ